MDDIEDTNTPEAIITAGEVGGGDTAKATRERSKIVFPYFGLEEAVGIAEVVHSRYGGRCDLDQLAASLNQKSSSGGFRLKVSAARIFGVIENASPGVAVTDLGSMAVDGRTRSQACATAFLNVPLYLALFDRFRGRTLPNDAGLEAAIRDLGVSPKQVQTARQVFQRSADYAGFFAHGRDRLVMPASGTLGTDESDHNGGKDELPPDTSSGSKVDIMTHPLILGLLGALPEPDEGFPEDDRDLWLEAAKVNLSLIYGKAKKDLPEGRQSDGATFKGFGEQAVV